MWKRIACTFATLAVLGACDRPGITPPDVSEAALAARAGGQRIEVKFHDELRVRADGPLRVRSASGADVAGLQAAIARLGARELRPLIELPDGRMAALEGAARARSGGPVPDLASWHLLVLPPNADVDAVLAALRAMPEVEHAYRAPEPAPPPFVAPDFTASQGGYFGPAPSGTENIHARSLPGGRGAGVTLVDLEYDWTFAHEDLQFPSSILIANQTYSAYGPDHGDATLGVLAGRDNGYGVVGGAPDANLRVAGAFVNGAYNLSSAITNAASLMTVGDVLLLEQQAQGPGAQGEFVPVEWIPSVFDAIKVATGAGIVVIEPAGNGGANLDASVFSGRFNRAQYNSGAVIVGAGDAYNQRMSFSSYGSRVDVQAHGTSVTTAGYGDAWGSAARDRYTYTFGGTSSASAIVAAAATVVQGYKKHRGWPVLGSGAMATLFTSTGSPQGGNTAEHIGPKPNLAAALATLTGPSGPLSVEIDGSDNIRTPGTHTWEAMPAGGGGSYTYYWTLERPDGSRVHGTDKQFSWYFGCEGYQQYYGEVTVTSGSETATASLPLNVEVYCE